MSSRRERIDLINWAESNGWSPERRNGGHLVFRHKIATQSIFVSSTPSNHRGFMNAKADMKRAVKQCGMQTG